MTPKEKAKELVFKKFGCSKRYALLAVDEILDSNMIHLHLHQMDYWQEVKQEIEKL
jgi:hypothetical protein